MGSLKPEQESGGGLPWHELHSRPSSLQLPWIPGKEDNKRNFRGGIDAGAASQGPGFGVQLPSRVQVQIPLHHLLAQVKVKQDTQPP